MPVNIDKLNADIAALEERLEQKKRQKRAQEKRDQEKSRKEDTRRKIVIGGIVLKYFPELSELAPQRSNADNDIEFASLANLLSVLATDKELVDQLKAKALEKSHIQAMHE